MSREAREAGSTVVHIQDAPEPDHVVWSLFNTIFLNACCLGLAAFLYSIKSRDRKMVGDMPGARGYASTSKKLNIAATTLSIISFLVIIIITQTTKK